MLELVRIHRDNKVATTFFDEVVERVRAFSTRWDNDGDALANTIWQLYASRSSALGLWAIVEGDTIVGHLLANVQQWDTEWVGWVTQLEVDEPYQPVPKRLWQDGLTELEGWKSSVNELSTQSGINLRRLMFTTTRDEHAWLRLAGFRYFRTIMVKDDERPA